MTKQQFKAAVFVIATSPMIWLAYQIWQDDFGADPIAEIMSYLGDCALWVLLASLAVTPIWQRTGFNLVMHLRI